MEAFSIKLTPLSVDDSPLLFSWINDRQQVLFNSAYKPVHPEQHDAWFESIQTQNNLVIFAIRHLETLNLIGTCQLHSINTINRSAELQIRIGAIEERDKGFGTQAVKLLLDFGFKDLNLNKIYLYVFKENARAIRVYEKVGFVCEGILRQAVYRDGRYVDVVFMGLLKDEYIG